MSIIRNKTVMGFLYISFFMSLSSLYGASQQETITPPSPLKEHIKQVKQKKKEYFIGKIKKALKNPFVTVAQAGGLLLILRYLYNNALPHSQALPKKSSSLNHPDEERAFENFRELVNEDVNVTKEKKVVSTVSKHRMRFNPLYQSEALNKEKAFDHFRELVKETETKREEGKGVSLNPPHERKKSNLLQRLQDERRKKFEQKKIELMLKKAHKVALKKVHDELSAHVSNESPHKATEVVGESFHKEGED